MPSSVAPGGQPGRRALRLAGRALLVVLALVALFLAATPIGRYLVRAAWEEGWILARRQSIAALLAQTEGGAPRPSLTSAERERLRLVTEARTFAAQSLGLSAGESFTQYSRLDRDTLVLVLSAARRDTLAAHTWWFPVVGRFPYKGFFDFDEARRAADEMRRQGFDTYLRPASAFSTLGWFNDPLLSTTLRLDSLSLVNTVIHELTHNTVFVRNEVTFNESLASFVGARGAAAFFRARGDVAAARAAEAAWRDDKLLGAFWGATLAAVDSAYARYPGDSAARVAARDTVFQRMRSVLLRDVAPRLPHVPTERWQRLPLDNASLLARRVYAADLWLFDAVHQRAGTSLAGTVALITRIARDDSPAPSHADAKRQVPGGRAQPGMRGGEGKAFERLRAWLDTSATRSGREGASAAEFRAWGGAEPLATASLSRPLSRVP